MFKKYKKKILRVAVVVTSIVVLFVMSAMPASAASDGWTTSVFNDFNENLGWPTVPNAVVGYVNSNKTGWDYVLPNTLYGDSVQFFVRFNTTFDVKIGDRIIVNDANFSGYFNNESQSIISVKYILCQYYDAGGGITDAVRFLNNGVYTDYVQTSDYYSVTVKSNEFYIAQDYERCFVAVMFKVQRPAVHSTFSIRKTNVHFGYGNPNSPEYQNYKSFDSNYINNLSNYEDQVLNDSKGGLTAFGNSISTMQGVMRTYMAPLVAATDMLNIFLGIRSLDDIVNLSLTFGVIAFLLSSSLVAYVARSSRADSSVKVKHGRGGGKNG